MSNDCSSGTPAFIIVASWRVKIAMSFSLDLLAAAHAALLDLGDQDALAAQAGADHGSRRRRASRRAPVLPLLVLAFPLEDDVLDLRLRAAAVAMCRGCPSSHLAGYSLVTADHFFERGQALLAP